MRKLAVLAAAALVVAIGLIAPTAGARSGAQQADIVDTAVGAGQFSTLATLLQKTGLVETLKGTGPFTVFAPTDAAFSKVPQATLDALAADPALLRSVLLYHVVSGNVPSSAVVDLPAAKTVQGADVLFSTRSGGVYVNDAQVVTPDIQASNGVIHVVDSVLVPPAKPTKNIVGTAVSAGSFKVLTALLVKAGLASTLRGPGTFTVFAPTDAAFAKVPKRTLAALGKNPALLKRVLLYHVVKGAVPASTVATLNGKSVRTLAGARVSVRLVNGKIALNKSAVTTPNVFATNGVIHVINRVLLPPAK
jgi:transforming growth factor-beta-induced protein